jgi:hypothetical protein
MTASDDNEKKITRLKGLRSLNALERHKVEGEFPIVPAHMCDAATDAFFALAQKYAITGEDLHLLMKAYGLMFYRNLPAGGFLEQPLPPTACEQSAVALRAQRMSQNDWDIQQMDKVRDFHTMPAFKTNVLWYAISDAEYRISRNAFYAIAERYEIPQSRQLQLRRCMLHMLFWTLAAVTSEEECVAAVDDPKIKWQ